MPLKQSRKKKEIMGQDLTQAAKALGAAPIPKGEGEAQAKPWSLARPPALRLSLRPWRRAQKQRPWGTSQFPSQSRLLRARPGAQVPPGAEAADGGGGEVQRAGFQERRSWEGDAGVEKGGRHRTDAKWSSDRGT